MDQIIIKDLEVFYRVGVPDQERAKPQRLLLTVELEHDFTRAAGTDNLRKRLITTISPGVFGIWRWPRMETD
jgi:FolB domain-containing protein